MSKALITGAGGMLAWDLEKVFADNLGYANTVALDVSELDITDPARILSILERVQPDVVINAAAYTDVDGAERDRSLAHEVNALGPAKLAHACDTRGIHLIHFSTDHVFDGSVRHPRTEEERVAPINWYGQTKAEGEKAVLQAPRSLVLRIQWLYGEKKDRFTSLRDKKIFTPFSDQYGAPTWSRRVAEVTYALWKRRAAGLYHFSHDDYASWSAVFEFVRDALSLKVKLEPKKSAEISLPARRPEHSVLSNRKICETLGVPGIGSWKTDLAQFLEMMERRERLS